MSYDLKARLLEVMKLHSGDYDALSDGILACVVDFGADAVTALFPEIDPDRTVFEHPVRPGELGLQERPMMVNLYGIYSDVYNHNIWGDGDLISETEIDTFYEASEDGLLYDYGRVAIDLNAKKSGFLLIVDIARDAKINMDDLAEFTKNTGMDAKCLAEPNLPAVHGGISMEASLVITAFIPGTDKLNMIDDLYFKLSEIGTKWDMDRDEIQVKKQKTSKHKEDPNP